MHNEKVKKRKDIKKKLMAFMQISVKKIGNDNSTNKKQKFTKNLFDRFSF
jgi:hypothetical protein